MSSTLARNTPFGQLWQLLSPNPSDYGKNFETEIRRLGVLGLQFAAIVAIVIPSANLFIKISLWYFQREIAFMRLLYDNIENLAVALIGISALSLSRTSLGQNQPNAVVIVCTIIAETLSTVLTMLHANPATYPPFVISLLILSAVVPVRPAAVALIGGMMIGINYLLYGLMPESSRALNLFSAAFPLPFFAAIVLVCTGLTTIIYHLRVKSYSNFDALQKSQERLQKELAVAGVIQMHSLPRQNPVVPGLSIAGVCLSATEVGGDYYDYIGCDNGKFGVLVGDVSGKGTSAALYMSRLQGIVRALQHLHHAPARLLVAVNDLIHGAIEKTSFITLTYAVFDLEKKRVTLSRAGHNATLYFQNDDHHFLIPAGLGLGLTSRELFEKGIEEVSLKLNPEEILVFYTDGLIEARNLSGEEFGEDRLVELIAAHRELDAKALNQKIVEEVKKFVGFARQHDDMTVLVAKVE
jgi:serine phosphatase RsbU (regulator of sigma subunit)